MREVTKEEVFAALKTLGIRKGEGLLVHSAVQFLGRPAGGVGMYYEALCEALGISDQRSTFAGNNSPVSSNLNPANDAISDQPQNGTLAVPAFNFAFARGEPYDPQSMPSQGMGVFSEYVRQLPEALRTPHPMQSLAVVGRWASDLAGRDTPSAFDPGSAFERMLELDFRLLLLGAEIQAVSMLHYSEQHVGVPYRYWKEFQGQVRTPGGWEKRTYRMFARDLEADAHIELYPVQALLEQRGQWLTTTLNYGKLSLCRLADFVAAVDEFLSADPWSLVVNREEAIKVIENKQAQ
jgi:aminoglycoside 3-N-acetyltransferase